MGSHYVVQRIHYREIYKAMRRDILYCILGPLLVFVLFVALIYATGYDPQ